MSALAGCQIITGGETDVERVGAGFSTNYELKIIDSAVTFMEVVQSERGGYAKVITFVPKGSAIEVLAAKKAGRNPMNWGSLWVLVTTAKGEHYHGNLTAGAGMCLPGTLRVSPIYFQLQSACPFVRRQLHI
jgi:hypothetical protein